MEKAAERVYQGGLGSCKESRYKKLKSSLCGNAVPWLHGTQQLKGVPLQFHITEPAFRAGNNNGKKEGIHKGKICKR